MTTIAWDGKTLAADTQSSIFRSNVTKIHRTGHHDLYGASGRYEDLIAVLEWIDKGSNDDKKPKLEDTFHAIWIRDYKLVVLEQNLIPMPHKDRKYFAVGSGRDFAMAAMYLGESAKQAVQLAHIFDVNTGPEVETLLNL